MDRGEVEVEEARHTRVRRASILTTNKERNECEVMYNSCAKGRAKHHMRSIVWEVCLDAWALGGVLFKGDFGSSAQVLIDEIQFERSEEAVV